MSDIQLNSVDNVVKIHGEFMTELPHDLFIPPEALRIFLETFEGPLDLLLYLIKKQNFDILDIPIAEITKQYVQYIELMTELQLELAADYLVMAAMLAEIKSRLLLPRPTEILESLEDDPRAELVRRLQQYEQFKQAAVELDSLAQVERDFFIAEAKRPDLILPQLAPQVELAELLAALQEVMKRTQLFSSHKIVTETLSVRERMTQLLARLNKEEFNEFSQLFDVTEGRAGVVVTLLAILELVKQTMIELTQAQPFDLIYVKKRA